MIQRVLTVLLAVPILLGALFSPWPVLFKLLIFLAILVGITEFANLSRFSREEKIIAVVLGGFHASLLMSGLLNSDRLLLEISLVLMVVFFSYLITDRDLPGIGQRIGLMVTGIFYVATLGATIGLIRDRFQGEIWVLMLLAMTWLNDTAAYFVGHWWGRRKLAPLVSPGKTREGFLGGLLGSLIGFVIVWFLFGGPLPFGAGLTMAGAVGLVAPVGDLAESLLKRGFGAKDSGHIIPGHGGLLDRIDALLFAAPVVYGFALQYS